MTKRFLPKLAIFVCVLIVNGCASDKQAASRTPDNGGNIADPFEGYNRVVFQFNDALDQTIAEPAARGYKEVVPDRGRKGVRNVLRNLNSPVIIANQTLQGDFEGAGDAVTRALVNTLIGFGGLIDIASHEGIEYEQEDFGQTLAIWGVGRGFYVVAPLWGPASLRQHAGVMVDSYADPLRFWLFNTGREEWYYARTGVSLLDRRVQLLDVLDDLRSSSIDYYASVRSTTQQRRRALIRDDKPDDHSLPEIPDYN